MRVRLWGWKMEMHLGPVFVMKRVLRGWPDLNTSLLMLSIPTRVPRGRKRKLLTKLDGKMWRRQRSKGEGGHCWFSTLAAEQTAQQKKKKTLLRQASSERLFTLVVISHRCLTHVLPLGFVSTFTHVSVPNTMMMMMSSVSRSLKSSSLLLLPKQIEAVVAIYLMSLFNKLRLEVKMGCLSSARK